MRSRWLLGLFDVELLVDVGGRTESPSDGRCTGGQPGWSPVRLPWWGSVVSRPTEPWRLRSVGLAAGASSRPRSLTAHGACAVDGQPRKPSRSRMAAPPSGPGGPGGWSEWWTLAVPSGPTEMAIRSLSAMFSVMAVSPRSTPQLQTSRGSFDHLRRFTTARRSAAARPES
jgi:hypothetical protein